MTTMIWSCAVARKMIMVRKGVRILFEVDGRRYEAVEFLREGETSVLGDEMLRRAAGENGGAIGTDDCLFLQKRLGKLPPELNRYMLVTNRRYPGYPHDVLYFDRDNGRWLVRWRLLEYRWFDYHLVVRRCS